MTTIKKHLTQVVFWSAVFLSVLSIALVFVLEDAYSWVGLVLIGLSILFNLWSVRRSENSGFVQSREYRRAYEPARRFNMIQVFTVFGLVMVQCGVGAYALLT